jgi:hypothetical protein
VRKGTISRVMVASRPKVSFDQMAAPVPEIMGGSLCLVTAICGLIFHVHESVAIIILTASEHIKKNYCEKCPSTCLFTRGFNTMVLHHIPLAKCINRCPKAVVSAGLVR